MLLTRAIVWVRPSNRAAGGEVMANAIACVSPAGPDQPGARVAAGMVSACQGGRVATGQL